jgi:pimeloyl-ACP methyl ester carboxylesterase
VIPQALLKPLGRRQPPIWREGRAALELATLLRDPIYRGEGVADARGQPVLLIPGLLAGDDSLSVMTRWLRRTGHHTSRAGMRLNVDCSASAADRIEARLERLAERHGGRVAIVGQSRGGCFARVLAQRRPELVSGIVTLATPQLDPFAIHSLVRASIVVVGAIGTLGARGVFRRSCVEGDCCASFWEDFERPFPKGVGYASLYSTSDGIVDWRACLDPEAVQVEVDASHLGMGVNREAYREIARALRSFRRADARRSAASHRASLPKAA